MNKTLITKDAKGKIRVAEINCELLDSGIYLITRVTYQYGGKRTNQPSIEITEGKAKRTIKEQAELKFNSLVKEKLDKGYKEIENPVDTYTHEELENIVGQIVTDANGFAKHMLAKQADKVSDKTINKLDFWYASRKIDGVRCSFYWKDEEIHTASRGGGHYDYSTYQLRTNPEFIEFFKNNPNIILDGELYKHGKSLQQISGAARMEKTADGCDWLEYYIYDVMEPKPFSERLQTLNRISLELNLGFDPNRVWSDNDLRVQMVPQEKVSGKENIIALHDKYVAEGWEGCVVRDPNGLYKNGGRGSEMIKFKMYQDAEFEITGISEGLRDEDMCFTLKTENGIEFKAKPMGSRELKDQYRQDIDELIGKMATVKFFYYSDDGTPLQPVLKAIRDYE